jgi:hypothetical protein
LSSTILARTHCWKSSTRSQFLLSHRFDAFLL